MLMNVLPRAVLSFSIKHLCLSCTASGEQPIDPCADKIPVLPRERAMTFRYDINALRALAVTAVVLFHYKVSFVPGGFVGVDVFFVISGYLMTIIITKRLEAGKFNIVDFYYDRAKRIVPGLLGMCLVLLIAGYFILEPATYQYLGSTAISALLFFSNLRFWEATGYFDTQSDTKWLLHTWSLSVEWQFYLIYPVLLSGLSVFERTRRLITPILAVIAAVSLVACIWHSSKSAMTVLGHHPYQPSAFYLLPQRAWELLAGGIVALRFSRQRWKHSLALVLCGLALIAVSILSYGKGLPWPSYWALLPVLGTCLIIAGNRPNTWPFQNAIVQTIGKWSYSIYLWHWPIAVGALYLDFVTTTPLKIAGEIAVLAGILAVGGSIISVAKKILEERVLAIRHRALFAGAGAVSLAVMFAVIIASNSGLTGRWPEGTTKFEDYDLAVKDWNYPDECNGFDSSSNLRPCHLGDAAEDGVLILGDSFAEQFFGRFADKAGKSPSSSFTFLTSAGCPPLTGLRMLEDKLRCNGFFDKAFDFAEAKHFKRVVLISDWYDYFNPADGNFCFVRESSCIETRDPAEFFNFLDRVFDALRGRLLRLREKGAQIAIIGATPRGEWNVPAELAKRKFLQISTAEVEIIDRDVIESYAKPMKTRLVSLAASIGADFVDPLDYLCENRICPTVDRAGIPYYRDKGHFRSSAVTTARFEFLDKAAGLESRVSATPATQAARF